ncbi:amidohydrolase family protein [Roseomonas elaeocarpi]|uniref:Amidohydrolase family protein n=1 Tax=Roseomonas elaeocarpi TaxID=907779 RepID=A0ABV6JWU1_9PROT
MASRYVDIHPHVISTDEKRYPHSPLFGKQSDWSKERPTEVENLIEFMDEAGVEKAAIVQSSTCYGYDNSYVCDAVQRYPGRFTAVGSVDLMQPDAPQTIRGWTERGLTGLRLFTGGSTKEFDTSELDDPRSFAAWETAGELGLPICIQTGPVGLAQVAGLAKRFPQVKIILDHLARPVIDDGAPYKKAVSLFALAPFENVYLKLTPRIFTTVVQGAARPDTFFPKLIEMFGASRLAWGSNYPASEGSMKENLEIAEDRLSVVGEADRRQIFARTAQSLYPTLKD